MKKILVVFSCCAFFAACSNSETAEEGEEYYNNSNSEAEVSAVTRQSEADTSINDIGTDRTATAPAASENQASENQASENQAGKNQAGDNYEKGKNLIASSDCLSCHQIDQKVVGPAYQEVAAKYEMNDKNLDYLANKIKEGVPVYGGRSRCRHTLT